MTNSPIDPQGQRHDGGKEIGRVPRPTRVFAFIWTLLKARRVMFLLGLALMLLNRSSSLVLPATTRFIVDDIVAQRNLHKLPSIIAIILAATCVQALTSLGTARLITLGGQRIIADLRIQIFNHMSLLPISYYDENRVGTLVSRIMADVEGIRNLVGAGLMEFVGAVITAVLAFAMLLHISFSMTAVTALFVSSFLYLLVRMLRALWPIYRLRSRTIAEVTGRLAESLSGIRLVKSFNAEAYETNAFSVGVRTIMAIITRAITKENNLALLSHSTTGLIGIWVVYDGIHMVVEGRLSLGNYLTYTILLTYMISPLWTAVAAGTQLTEVIVGIDRSIDVLEQEQEHMVPENSIEVGEISGRVSFEQVSFGYSRDTPVLHNISFIAEPNKTLALVGSSGSGKSTIAHLICAFHHPQKGCVTVDGIDLRTVKLSSYRRHLGVVLQESFLFHGTIRENVAYGRLGATHEQIIGACHAARVDEFAEQLPDKYETVVGERGVKLSGGQRQRISLARALLANPRILILDEATSNLDSESEQIIQEALTHLMRDRTTIIIAHRLSTIQRADIILVLEDGQIIERGNHHELYSASGRYRSLYNKQHSMKLFSWLDYSSD